jgi:hypothetical protein
MHFRHWKRRQFITVLGSAAAWPLAARAQQAVKLPTIGFLGQSTPSVESQRLAALLQRLRQLGWVEGRNVAIELRWGEGRNERYAEIAAEFVRLKVDVILTAGTVSILAAKQATSVIPIVFAVAGDPIGDNKPVSAQKTLNWRAFSVRGQPTPPRKDGQQRAAMHNGGLRLTGEIFYEGARIDWGGSKAYEKLPPGAPNCSKCSRRPTRLKIFSGLRAGLEGRFKKITIYIISCVLYIFEPSAPRKTFQKHSAFRCSCCTSLR